MRTSDRACAFIWGGEADTLTSPQRGTANIKRVGLSAYEWGIPPYPLCSPRSSTTSHHKEWHEGVGKPYRSAPLFW